ncbi:class I SAM-dependent RNA methyltransferase [Sphingobium sp. CR28]|uniref:class I SAM-dependent RNA methyltransferase n=1 Tax=Sphingobium sp. CR28 TaxID=3400272 RepID=UPI003FEE1353
MTATEAADIIVRIAARGEGVTADGRHVPFAAPGDRLLPDGGLAFGPDHVEPVCIHVPDCGGCQLQHVSDAAYAAYVRDRVAGALAGQGLEADAVLPAHISPPRTRRRASLRAVRQGKTVLLGFAAQGSHRIIDMHECHVLEPQLFALVAPLRALVASRLADRRSAEVRLALTDQGVDVQISGLSFDGLEATEAVLDFARTHGLARLALVGAEGEPSLTIWEPDPVTVTFGGVGGNLAVAYPPHAFLQATRDGEAALLAAVREGIGNAAMVADLFAGLGTFALSVAGDVPGRKVYAAEAARDLIGALQLAGNRLPGRIFPEHRDLFRRPLTAKEAGRFDAIVIDPPRAGAREQCQQLAEASCRRLVYVSCNPASFGRDAVMLVAGGYRIATVQPVGQFRWSTHVELAASFVRD